jgi:HAD superfamily phosphatase (TIGR01668 family)
MLLKRFLALNPLRRSLLRPSRASLPRQVLNLASIDLKILKVNRIQGVILDLDNTLISEDDRYLSPNAETWIQKAKEEGFQFFILSNGKRRYRVEFWSHRLNIPALSPAKKPFPFSFRTALIRMQLSSTQVVVIGDSHHTDTLGAWLVGCPSIQVASLPHPHHWWEKGLGKYLHTSYPQHEELWEWNGFR